jgi:hypothetical protein
MIARPAEEVLLQVLPDGFVRICRFGFLASCGRPAKLARRRALLAAPPSAPATPEPAAALLRRVTSADIGRWCPVCRAGRLRAVAVIRPGHLPAQHWTPHGAPCWTPPPVVVPPRRARRDGGRASRRARSPLRPVRSPLSFGPRRCPSGWRWQGPSLGPKVQIQSPMPVGQRFSSNRFTRRTHVQGRGPVRRGARRSRAYSSGCLLQMHSSIPWRKLSETRR